MNKVQVGRGPERRQVEALLSAARLGQSGVLVVTGEAGIGKTALLDHARRRAAAMVVLGARGVGELDLVDPGEAQERLALDLGVRVPLERAGVDPDELVPARGRAGEPLDLLEREGYSVAEAADGIAALDQVDRVAPDVIMLDLNLPDMTGIDILANV